MKVVLDAGPIIALAKTAHLELLPRLFDEVLVPAAVLREVAPRGERRPGAELRRLPWAHPVRVLTSRVRTLEVTFDIGAGEAAAIAVAESDAAHSIVLMDDRRGLSAAAGRGVLALRTGALFVHAVEERVIEESAALRALALLTAERYLSAAAERDVLRLLASRRKG